MDISEVQFIDLAGVKRLLTLSTSTVVRLRKNEAANFPVPVLVGRRHLFLKSEVVDWAMQRLAARPERPRTFVVDANVRHSAR
jgi:predicted DNA-binding transcriptional regulator AlpA